MNIQSSNNELPQDNKHIVLLSEHSNGRKVFIIPGIGGLCETYVELASNFDANYSVYGLTMMGILPEEKPLSSIKEIVEQNIKWIKSIQPNGPYILLGHSFGGHVVFEMTRQLERSNDKLDAAVILDTEAHLHSELRSLESEIDLRIHLISSYLESFGLLERPYPSWTYELLEKLSAAASHEVDRLLFDYLPQKITQQDDKLLFVIRLINLRLKNDIMEYSPTGKIDSKLVVFRAEDAQKEPESGQPGWSFYAHNYYFKVMPGNHDMYNNENSKVVTDFLKSILIPEGHSVEPAKIN